MGAGWIVGLTLGTAAFAWGQASPADKPKPGILSGTVIDGKSSEPVRKATVILRVAQPGRGIGTAADAAGKFNFEEVEPGAYTVIVERDGYVMAPESLRQVVTVKAGETTTDVKMKMLRTGVISGRVLDEEGEPLRGVNVQIIPSRRNQSTPRGGWASSNDRGEYRAFNIAPGEYKISAVYAPPNHNLDTDFQVQPAVTGSKLAASSAYPTTYYPGSFDLQRATAVKVEPGSEMPGFDFHLVRQHAVKVRGRVTGLPASTTPVTFAMVTLRPIGQAPGQPHDVMVRDTEGRFELSDVLPGTYEVTALANVLMNETLTARRTLEVSGSDIEGIQLTVAPSRTLNGHLLFPKNHKLPSGLMIVLQSREPGGAPMGGFTAVAADGNFSIGNVVPGQYSALLGNTGGDAGDLYISAIHMGDTDALAEGVSIGAAPPASLEVTLKPNGGALASIVKDDKGVAIPGAMVVLVPDAPKDRHMALYGECRTSPEGNCSIAGITPGDYHAFAFSAEGAIGYRDPDALKPFEKYGKAVKFAEGDKQTIDLVAVPLE